MEWKPKFAHDGRLILRNREIKLTYDGSAARLRHLPTGTVTECSAYQALSDNVIACRAAMKEQLRELASAVGAD